MDARPFGSARWAATFVRADQNGHGRTKWIAPLELLLVLPIDLALYIIVMGCWSTWMVRNDKIFKQVPAHPISWTSYLKEGLYYSMLRAKQVKANKLQS